MTKKEPTLKTILILTLGIISLVSVFLPTEIAANGPRVNCPEDGFVPCGTKGCPCQLCDFFVMFDKIADFILFEIVPPIAVLMFVIGGVMFFLAGGSPESVNRAKGVLTATLIGLLIIYGAWLLINTFFTIIGVAEWTKLQEGWFNYPCP